MKIKTATMYRQGGGWVVSILDPKVRANRLTEGLTYSQARQMVGEANCPGGNGGTCREDNHQHESEATP